MLGALKVYARANQATIVTPFILAGAMSPVTVAGTLTQVLAEVLAGAALTQLCRPGAPVVIGCFAASISMQSGAPTFGTPEPTLVSYGAAQLARRLGIPFRTGGALCASKVVGRAGRLRERQHAELDGARRHQFRAARRRLAGRRALLRLREIRHGLRPARHAAALHRRRRPHRERPGAFRHPRGRARARTISAASTRRTISRRRSTAPPSPTTIPSSNGWRRARRPPSSAPTRSGRSGSPNTRRRRSTRASTRR